MSEQLLWQMCYTCRDYAEHRREAIAQPLADKAKREGRNVIEVVDEFMLNAHSRHMSTGEPLRPDGPTSLVDPRLRRIAMLMASGLFGEEDV